MPVYEYRCKSCGETHEIDHGYNDDRPTKCSTCGGQLIRVFHPIGLVFKGSGFHKTDYGKSGIRASSSEGPSGGAGDGKPSEGKPSEGASAKEKPGEGKPAESKPADSKPSDSKPASDTKPAKAP
jgi:putative FmdB family regulatory protein